ncbi:MAG: GNAT family N-acetyltransferase [Planctomycetota bacterium]
MAAPPVVREIGAAELDADLRRSWQAVRESDPRFSSPYFHPEFTAAVADVRDDVRVAVCERDGRAVGFFPFQRDASGDGLPVGGRLCDFHGVVAADADVPSPGLLLSSCGLRTLRLENLVAEDRAGFDAHCLGTAETRHIDLAEGFDAWHARVRETRGSDIRELGRKRRRLERDVGKISFKLCAVDHEALATLIEWKSRQYERTGLSDVFGVDWTRRLLTRLLDGRDGLSGCVTSLRAGGRLVAAQFGMLDASVWHYWFPAYDLEFAKYSPGSLLLMESARVGPVEGVRRIDLGRGDERYKSAFGDGVDRVAECVLTRNAWRGSSAKIVFAGKRWLRRSPWGAPVRYSARLLRPWRERNRFR